MADVVSGGQPQPAPTQTGSSGTGNPSGRGRRGRGRSRRQHGPGPAGREQPASGQAARWGQPGGQPDGGLSESREAPLPNRPRRGRWSRGGGILSSQRTIVPTRSFGGRLTVLAGQPAARLDGGAAEFVPGQPVAAAAGPAKAARATRKGPSTAADLPTRIHEDIDSGNYDCCICLNAVERSSRLWTCPICWRVTHYACVAKWLKQRRANADSIVGDANGNDRTLRCPACNSELPEDAAREKHCWCGRQKAHSATPFMLPPHSCGRLCGKTRGLCLHPCAAVCHAGPCPPCSQAGPATPCFCGKHMVTRACVDTDYANGWSCGEVCDSKMPCGTHRCTRTCHADGCGDCVVPMPSTCYCGKEHKEVPCRLREAVRPSYGREPPEEAGPFEGSFSCDAVCGRPFDCGVHACQRGCHPQDRGTVHCRLSPDVVTHCPCGKTALAALAETPRTSCTDPIPHCSRICDKRLPCGHPCATQCHEGACPPCAQTVPVRCRCGREKMQAVCGDTASLDFACETPCRALLSCGQHKCRRVCCPGREKATARQTAARGRASGHHRPPALEYEAEHVCLVVCGRPLRCGRHTCAQLCHRGACLSCTEMVMEPLACACGRTVLQPPLPCGTTLPPCQFDCTRPLPCGHATVAHRCHGDEQACPRCPQLVAKVCLCGKYSLPRVACGTGALRCDKVCGLPLQCGLHTCTKTCHRPGECEDATVPCQQPCGRAKTLCGHACDQPCHGPTDACPEDEPCALRTVVTCACQRRKQEVRCLVCRANPTPTYSMAPTCDDECRRQQRNAALRGALGVDAAHEDDHVPYAAETLEAFRRNRVWAEEQELLVRAFADDAEQRRLRFTPMSAARRAFLHMLAADFGLDSQSQDPDPHRHVSLFKTPRFVSAPAKTLAQCALTQQRVRAKERETALLEAAEAAAVAAAAAEAARQPQRHPCNAILLPARLADEAAGHAEVLADLVPPVAAAAGLSIRPATFAPAVCAGGETVLRAVVPAAAPAAVEQLLRSLVPYLEAMVGSEGAAEGDDKLRLCHVDGHKQVVWREGDEDPGVLGSGDVGQWNVVARAGRRAAAGASAGSTGTGRRVLTLKRPTTAAERQRRMEILAQAEEEKSDSEEEAKEGESEGENEKEENQEKEEETEREDDKEDNKEDDAERFKEGSVEEGPDKELESREETALDQEKELQELGKELEELEGLGELQELQELQQEPKTAENPDEQGAEQASVQAE